MGKANSKRSKAKPIPDHKAKQKSAHTPQLPHPQLEHEPPHLQVEQAQGDILALVVWLFVCW